MGDTGIHKGKLLANNCSLHRPVVRAIGDSEMVQKSGASRLSFTFSTVNVLLLFPLSTSFVPCFYCCRCCWSVRFLLPAVSSYELKRNYSSISYRLTSRGWVFDPLPYQSSLEPLSGYPVTCESIYFSSL